MVEGYCVAEDSKYGMDRELISSDFEAYLSRLDRLAKGVDLNENQLQTITLWLVQDEKEVVGVFRLRPHLNDLYRQVGGHIGYDIAPAHRGKGYGTRLLALGLEEAKRRGLTRLFLTCNADNVASARIIEKNGGQFQDEIFWEKTGIQKRRYWIELE